MDDGDDGRRWALLRCGRGGAAEGGGLDDALVLLPGTAGARAAAEDHDG